MTLDQLVAPAVIIAALALVVDAIKGVVDLVLGLLARRDTQRQSQLAFLLGVSELLEGMPIDAGDKVVAKRAVMDRASEIMRSTEFHRYFERPKREDF